VLLGSAILFLISVLDNRLSSLEEISAQIPYPVLASLPSEKEADGKRLPLLKKDDPRVILAEAYRNLRSAILHAKVNDQAPKVLALTSSVPSEGKTTISANLASVLSMANKRVLVIDADLRKGRLHEDFALLKPQSPTPGLSDFLSGALSAPPIVEYSSHLHLLPRGAPQEHPSELLTNGRIVELLQKLRPQYDYILLDTPPLLAAEDVILVSPCIDALLYVVRAHFTQSSQMHAAMRMLRQRELAPLGVIFNLLDIEHPNYYHYKYSDYYHRPSRT